MTSNTTMQFYLNKKVDDSSLISEFNTLLGMRVESIEQPDEQASAFLMVTEYETGFATGANISWNPELSPKNDYLEVAKRLAARYQTQVATDLPTSDPSASDPFYWCVASPSGTLAKITQDTNNVNGDTGLILNGYRKPLLSA